jgi:hypothetical protein
VLAGTLDDKALVPGIRREGQIDMAALGSVSENRMYIAAQVNYGD